MPITANNGNEAASKAAAAVAMPQFRHPFTMCVAGCTGSGKSQWVLRFLQHLHTLVHPCPSAVLYCYGEFNENILRLQQQQQQQQQIARDDDDEQQNGHVKMHVHAGVPDESDVQHMARECNGRLLVVLDDLMLGMRSAFLDLLFTRGSHNWGCSVVLVTQHLFASREFRVARNNCHYLVLLRNPVGACQIRNLATQLFPGPRAYRFFMEAYENATAEPFNYLLIDMHPQTSNAHRLKTHIYPDEICVVYQPADCSKTSQ